MLKPVGFYSELNTSGSRGAHYVRSIVDDVRASAATNESLVESYLRAGRVLFDIMEMCYDVIGKREALPGGSSVVTDGEWIWRQDLEFYVRNYHLALPHDFLLHLEQNGYLIPPLEVDYLLQIADEAASFV